MRRRRPGARALVVAVVTLTGGLSACGAANSAAAPVRTSMPPVPSTSASDRAPGSAATPPDAERGATSPDEPVTGSPPALARVSWCDGLVAAEAGRVANADLGELSGMAASQRAPGVVWAHNDSGHEPALFAIGPDGADLGRFPLTGVAGVDIEDMALVDGVVHLADIGDNDRQRDEVVVFRFAEPDPFSPGPVTGVETLRFRYPDGPHDAEALLVDPRSGSLVVITKEFRVSLGQDEGSLVGAAPATVFVAEPPFPAGDIVVFEAAGTVALDQLDRRATGQPAEGLALRWGLGGLATGADSTIDGAVVALRTYETVWLFNREAGATVAEALAGEPCEAPTRPEAQGEAVAFVGDGPGLAIVTAGEAGDGAITRISPAGS